MKKLIPVLLLCLMAGLTLAGCGGADENTGDEGDKITVVTTIFPVADWTRTVVGDNPGNVEVIQLLDSGVDLHSFQPTAQDMKTIGEADAFIYVGGESDEWVEAALEEVGKPEMTSLNLMDVLDDKVVEEELVEGMEEEDHEHGDEHGDEEAGEHSDEEGEADEHIWLSVKNAALLTEAVAKTLSTVDEANGQVYETNAAAYVKELEGLDKQFEEAVKAGSKDTLVFADRFPFRYLTEDYGLKYYAAFAGCSAETEASFETVRFLAGKTDELGLSRIIKIEGSDGKIAETVVQNTKAKDQKILTMNSMQSATSKDAAEGATYISYMEENLKVLKEALQ